MVILTAMTLVIIMLGGCKKTWTAARPTATPTPNVKVVDPYDYNDGKNGNGSLVPAATLFPGKHGQEGTLTPTPTSTPEPTPVTVIVTRPPEDLTPAPTPLPTETPEPTRRPTNTPRPPKEPWFDPTPMPEATATPTPGSVDYILISGTPTPRGRN